MRHVTKNFSRITFSDSCKNVSDRSVAKENVLAINVVTRNNAKLALYTKLKIDDRFFKWHNLVNTTTFIPICELLWLNHHLAIYFLFKN